MEVILQNKIGVIKKTLNVPEAVSITESTTSKDLLESKSVTKSTANYVKWVSELCYIDARHNCMYSRVVDIPGCDPEDKGNPWAYDTPHSLGLATKDGSPVVVFPAEVVNTAICITCDGYTIYEGEGDEDELD